MNVCKVLASVLLVLSCTVSNVFAEELGNIFIESYKPQRHGAKNQIWGITQDTRGVMYFANSNGLVEFDGRNWSVLPIGDEEEVRSIDIDHKGVIYLGSKGNFGFLKEDSKGIKQFQSLTHLLPSSSKRFGKVWKTYCSKDGVFFITNNEVFFWDNSEITRFNIKRNGSLFNIEGKIIINDRTNGLLVFNGEKFEAIKGGESFNHLSVNAILPYDFNNWLVATKGEGIVLFNKVTGELSRPKTLGMINEYFASKNLNGGIQLEDESYLFSTLNGGAIVVNKDFRIERFLNKESQVDDETIWSTFVDREKQVWLGTNNGVFKVELNSPINFWNAGLGIEGMVKDIKRFNGIVYAATDKGIYFERRGQFVKVSHLDIPVHTLEVFENPYNKTPVLLAGTNQGLFEIHKFKANPVEPNCGPVDVIHTSSQFSNRVYIGTGTGLGIYEMTTADWEYHGKVKRIHGNIRSIVTDKDGALWLATRHGGITKVEFDDEYRLHPKVIKDYTKKHGLPDLRYNNIFTDSKGEVLVGTVDGLMYFNQADNKFYIYEEFGEEFTNNNMHVKAIDYTPQGIWINAKADNASSITLLAGTKDNNFFKRIPHRYFTNIFPELDGTLWIAAGDHVYRYNSDQNNVVASFHTNITEVRLAMDSSMFNGDHYSVVSANNRIDQTRVIAMENYGKTDKQHSSVSFKFSATTYHDERNNVYSYRLLGYNDEWSAWTKEHRVDYNNLRSTDYEFQVKAMNIYGNESEVTSYNFTILPPWYLSFWAIIIYALLGGYLVVSGFKVYGRKLQRKNEYLEGVIRARTAHIVDKNVELEAKKEEIEAQRDNLQEQTEIILNKNKTITDSLVFSKGIQEAIMTSRNQIGEMFDDHFILFKPKDIVSGDFYWATQIDGKKVWVTADCTGHGVPGALMSILGTTLLNEIVVKENMHLSANEILDLFRTKLIQAIDRKADKYDLSAKCGIDLALCIYDQEKGEMEFSGAYNSAYVVNEEGILEIQGTQQPVGVYKIQDRPFENHKVKINKGDIVYTFSDGFLDQFGGQKNAKFSSKRFKKMILDHKELSMEDQNAKFSEVFENWKGQQRQIDDVTVFGVRIN